MAPHFPLLRTVLGQMFCIWTFVQIFNKVSTGGIAGSASVLTCFNNDLIWKINTFNCQDVMLCDALVF